MTSLALIFDDHAAAHWRDGAAPRTPFSHDQNLFQLGHEALRLGMAVYATTIAAYLHGGPARAVRAIFPSLAIAEEALPLAALDPDILACVHPQVFAGGQLPRAKKVGLHPALYFIEMPHTYDDAQTLALFQAVRFHLDHIVVQNERMRAIVGALYEWLCRWRAPERVHVAPLGIVAEAAVVRSDRAAARAALGLGEQEIAIVNGGGIWRWTAFNDFLRGFCAAVGGGAGRLHLLLAGVRQAENADHGAYIEDTRAILREHQALVGGTAARAWLGVAGEAARPRIHLEPDWAEAGRRLPDLLSAADLGLSVSADSLENWQSHRVRCLDYLRYDLPILSTRGDPLSDGTLRDVCLVAADRTPDGFAALLGRLDRGEVDLARLRAGIASARDALDSRTAFGRLLLVVEAMPRRVVDATEESLLEYAWRQRRGERVGQIVARLTEAALGPSV